MVFLVAVLTMHEHDKGSIAAERAGVHVAHCCALHGCKYRFKDEYCPVEDKVMKQAYPCQYCLPVDEMEEEIARLQKELAFVKSLSS